MEEMYNLGKEHVESKYKRDFDGAYTIDREIYPKRKKEILNKNFIDNEEK